MLDTKMFSDPLAERASAESLRRVMARSDKRNTSLASNMDGLL
jgi:hypothetical protein